MVRKASPADRLAAIEARKSERAQRRRRKQYPLRLNDAERAQLEAAASARSLSPAEFLRAAFQSPAAGAHGHSAGNGPPALLDPAAVAALNRVGANLNQIARRVNSGDTLQPGELPDTLAALNDQLVRIETLVMAAMDR